MKVTIEEINGVEHTIVWQSDTRIGYWTNCGLFYVKTLSHLEIKDDEPNSVTVRHIATALPPIPRHPTKDDAWVLHLYAAYGLYLHGEAILHNSNFRFGLDGFLFKGWRGANCFATHAIDKDGNKVNIAIKD